MIITLIDPTRDVTRKVIARDADVLTALKIAYEDAMRRYAASSPAPPQASPSPPSPPEVDRVFLDMDTPVSPVPPVPSVSIAEVMRSPRWTGAPLDEVDPTLTPLAYVPNPNRPAARVMTTESPPPKIQRLSRSTTTMCGPIESIPMRSLDSTSPTR